MTPFRKIYIAGRYSRRAEFQEYAERLITQGHAITSSWLKDSATQFDTMLDPETNQVEFTKRHKVALLDLADVAACDMFIAFSQPRNDTEIGVTRGGRHFEAGYMYARIQIATDIVKTSRESPKDSGQFVREPTKIRQVLVGRRENVFEFAPGIQGFETFDELYAYLDTEIEQALQ